MLRSKAPKNLWDFWLKYVTYTQSLTDHPTYKLDGRTPYEILTGDTPDASEFF